MKNRIRDLFYTQQDQNDLDLVWWLMTRGLVEILIGETDPEGNNFRFKQTPEQMAEATRLLTEDEL